jgi:(p)ppGpp synthase/HD superfamily hydrolase
LLADVSSAITSKNVFIVSSRTLSKGEKAVLQFCVQVRNVEELHNVFAAIRTVKGVMRVRRVATAGYPQA